MQYQENLLDLLDDIEAGIETDHHLLDFKDFIKSSLLEGTKLVKEINVLSKDDPDYFVFKDAVEQLSNNLVRIHNINKDIFKEILIHSELTSEQVAGLSNGIEYSENKIEEMASLLVESYYKKTDILQNSNSKKMMARINYQDKSDNVFSEFITYVLEDVLPAQAMENLAKLSAFQRTRLNTVLEKDPIFSAIFDKYKENKELTTIEKRHIRETIEKEIKEMHHYFPVYRNKDNVEFAFFQNDSEIRVWDKTSGRNRPDAAGIDEKRVLYAYTVTSNINLDNQNNQVIEWANRISNGLKIGKLDISNFKIIACCNPILNELDDKGVLFKSFRKDVNDLEKIHIISKNEVDSLKRLAIDIELLSIFRNVSLDKYNELRDNIEFNILGESFCINPKESEKQYNESLERLYLSLNLVNKIIDNNPNLDKISTPIKLLMEGLSKGVYNGINSPLNNNNENDEIINKIRKSFTELKIKLVSTQHVSFKTMNDGLEDPTIILITSNILNEKYKEEKSIISTWKEPAQDSHTLTDKELKDFKNNDHNCRFDFSGSSDSHLSQIMKLTYNKGNICESLMNDALSFIGHKWTQNNFHRGTLNSLVSGVNNALNSDLPYDLKKACKSFVKNGVHNALVNNLNGENKAIIEIEIKKILDRKMNRKNKI